MNINSVFEFHLVLKEWVVLNEYYPPGAFFIFNFMVLSSYYRIHLI